MPAKKVAAKKTPARRSASAKKAPATRVKTKRPAKAVKTAKTRNAMDDMAGLWEDDLTTQYPSFRKNNFLSLIVLALGALLVVTGIYIQVNKEEPTNTQMTGESLAASGDVTTGLVSTTGSSSTTTGTIPTTGTFPIDAQRMVENFYMYFNQEQFDQIQPMYDANFTNVPGLRTYFNVNRLQNWKKNIIGDLQISEVNAVIDHPLAQRNPNAMVVQYKTHYLVGATQKVYDETWFAYVMKYGNTYKLNGFECQENCATSAFFQIR